MSDKRIDLMQYVEDGDGIQVIRGANEGNNANKREWNGIRYKTGLSGKNVGSKGLSMNLATVPPGACAYAHIHDGFEVMLFIWEGKVRHIYGENLEKSIDNEAGDFIYIEPGVPHEVYNIGEGNLVAMVARSAADEWDKIIDYPSERREQDGVPPKKLQATQ